MKSFLKLLFNGFLGVCIFILFQLTKVLAMRGSGGTALGVGIIGLLVIILIGWLVGKYLFQTTNESNNQKIRENENNHKARSQNGIQSWWDDITKPQTPLVEGNKSKVEIRKNKIGYEIVDENEEEKPLPYGKNPELKTLPFKSSYKAFEYTEKFSKAEPINTHTAFLGILALPSLVMIRVDDKGEAKRVYIYAEPHPELKSEIKKGDLVHVGIDDIGTRLVTYDEFMGMNEGTSDKDKLSDKFLAMLQEMPKGFILRKLKPILDLKTDQYIEDKDS